DGSFPHLPASPASSKSAAVRSRPSRVCTAAPVPRSPDSHAWAAPPASSRAPNPASSAPPSFSFSFLCSATLFCFFPFAAPIPPLALLCRQSRIPRLRNRRAENIEHARVLPFAGHALQLAVQSRRLLLCELPYTANPQHLEVPQHRRADREQVSQL